MLNLDDALPKLEADLLRGQLIIFVGSGISADSGLPTWEGFLSSFIEFCRDLSRQYHAYDIESYFTRDLFEDAYAQREKYPSHVATVLKERIKGLPQNIQTNVEADFKKWFFRLFLDSKPNPKHRLIVETDYPYILTSNYDTLLEDAAKVIGSPYSTLSFFQASMIAEAIFSKRPAIIHVHGTCSDILLDQIILTSEDYMRVIKKGFPGFSFSIQALFLNYSTVFVGYGASDPHLEDLIEEFSYYFDYRQSDQLSKNYLVVLREKAGRILEDYKKRMRTELIAIDSFEEYEVLLKSLRDAKPRQLDLPT